MKQNTAVYKGWGLFSLNSNTIIIQGKTTTMAKANNGIKSIFSPPFLSLQTVCKCNPKAMQMQRVCFANAMQSYANKNKTKTKQNTKTN